MKVLIAALAFVIIGGTCARTVSSNKDSHMEIPYNEELIVESLLNVRPKGQLVRQKRQFGQSSALANANAFNQYSGPGGFGANAANAGAQSFNSQGPLGGFGASAANSGSQGFSAGPGGFNANAAFGGSQTYDLPGGHHANLAYGAGYSNANGNPASSNTNSFTFTR